MRHSALSRRGTLRLAVALAVQCLCSGATAAATEDYSPDEIAFARLAGEMADKVDCTDYVRRVEAFAQKHAANQDLAARAHLHVVKCLARAKDYDAAIAKAKWLAKALPQAHAPRAYPFRYGPLPPMKREWVQYVQQHPIYIKDYAWFKIAEIQGFAGRQGEQLDTYERILRRVPPDEIPDTRNLAIVQTFRLHKETLDLKVNLLYSLGLFETGSFDEAKKAEAVRELLYPKEKWLALRKAARQARKEYKEAAVQEYARQAAIDEAKHLELEKSAERARRRNEEDAAAQRKREQELKAKDEQRTLRYLEWKRQREEREKAEEEAGRGSSPRRGATFFRPAVLSALVDWSRALGEPLLRARNGAATG